VRTYPWRMGTVAECPVGDVRIRLQIATHPVATAAEEIIQRQLQQRIEVPEGHARIFTARYQQLAIRAESDVGREDLMATERQNFSTGRNIPNPDRAVR
jgi:hypothetical protein